MRIIVLRTFWLLIALSFCFSCVKVVKSDSMMMEARKMIETAKEEKAEVYAPDHLEMCQKELSRAQQALEDGNSSRAVGWARRAMVDAELAALIAKSKRLKKEMVSMGGNESN